MRLQVTITRAGQTYGFDCKADVIVRPGDGAAPERLELVVEAAKPVETTQIIDLLPASEIAVELMANPTTTPTADILL